MKTEKPKLLDCEEGMKDKVYGALIKDGPFKDKDYKDIFMLALAIGFKKNRHPPLNKKEWLFRTDQLSDNSEDYWILKAVAVAAEGNLNVLLDEKKICSIAEEYANGGILSLKDEVFGKDFADYKKRLESDLRNHIVEIGLKKE